MMQELIRLAQHAEDERMRSVCLLAVLDRAGIRPIERPETDAEPERRIDPEKYSVEELAVIEQALRLLRAGRGDPGPAAEGAGAEILPPGDEEGSE